MTLNQIIKLFVKYLFVSILITTVLLIILILFYKLIYKKILHRKKNIEIKYAVLLSIFTIYIMIIICATFFTRAPNYMQEVKLDLFSSYREAYFTGSESCWINIILNILLFLPIGFLLPILNKNLRKIYKTVGIGFLITLIIEITQLITSYGVFEIDDIFNNTVGAMIGYGLIMTIFTLRDKNKSKKALKIIINNLALTITIAVFIIIFMIYNSKEFGNLEFSNTINYDMREIEIENKIENINTNRQDVMIYKTKKFSNKEIENLANEIVKRAGSEIDHRYNIEYDYFDTVYISTNGESIKINSIGGRYSISYINIDNFKSNYTNINESVTYTTDSEEDYILDKDKILNKINEIGIEFDYDYTYQIDNKYRHIFTVKMVDKGEYIVDGNIIADIDKNGSYFIDHNLIKYDKVKLCKIISENEAYEKVLSGKYMHQIDCKSLKKLRIESVELDYYLDSKEYYQPVYKFNVYINDLDTEQYIYVPAIIGKIY